MKIIKIILTAFTFFCISIPSSADDDFDGPNNPYGSNSSSDTAGALTYIAGGIAIGYGIYYLMKDDAANDETTARVMADYQNGKGLRITSYESNFNISLFKPVIRQNHLLINDSFINDKADKQKFNLINLSIHW